MDMSARSRAARPITRCPSPDTLCSSDPGHMGPSNIVTLAQTGHEHYTAGVEKTILRYPNVHSHQSSG